MVGQYKVFQANHTFAGTTRANHSMVREYLRGKYHCTVDLLFDRFGISLMTTDIFCFYL
jgi:hypothetical protein